MPVRIFSRSGACSMRCSRAAGHFAESRTWRSWRPSARDTGVPARHPGNLQSIVSRCLQKDPKRRFQSAADIRSALEDCLPLSITSPGPVKTIAVLPFENLSGDQESEYFSDGLSEEMIGALTKLPGCA